MADEHLDPILDHFKLFTVSIRFDFTRGLSSKRLLQNLTATVNNSSHC